MMASWDGMVLSSLQYTTRDFDMTESLLTVSTGVTMAMITSVIIGALLLGGFHRKLTLGSLMKNFFHLCRLMLGQSDHEAKSWSNMLIMISFGWAFFFFLNYWENLMSTDQVSIDRSRIINSLEDIVKNKTITSLITFQDPIANIIRNANDSISRGIMRNSYHLDATKPKDNTNEYPAMKRKLETGEWVMVVSEHVAKTFLYGMCKWRHLFEADFLIGKTKFLPAYFVPYYAKDIEREKKAYLDFRYMQFAEHGVNLKVIQEYQECLPAIADSLGSKEDIDMGIGKPKTPITYSAACPVDNLEEYFQNQVEVKSKSAPNMMNYKTVFAIFASGLFIAILVALIELTKRRFSKCASRLRKARRRSRLAKFRDSRRGTK